GGEAAARGHPRGLFRRGQGVGGDAVRGVLVAGPPAQLGLVGHVVVAQGGGVLGRARQLLRGGLVEDGDGDLVWVGEFARGVREGDRIVRRQQRQTIGT